MTDDTPNYDIRIDADELLVDLAERAAEYGHDYEEKRQWWRESLDTVDEWHDARYWMLEARGGQRAYRDVLATLQPGGRFRTDDGTVDVRAFMRWVSQRADAAHDDRHGTHGETRQADEAESAFARVLAVLRDDYGVGWPRIDDLGGVVEADLP